MWDNHERNTKQQTKHKRAKNICSNYEKKLSFLFVVLPTVNNFISCFVFFDYLVLIFQFIPCRICI